MKKHTKLLMATAAICLGLTGIASAAVIAQEDFTYTPDGTGLLGEDGGSGFDTAYTASGTGTSITVTTGVATTTAAHNGNFRSLTNNLGSSGELWVSIDMGDSAGTTYGGLSFFNGTAEPLYIGMQGGTWRLALPSTTGPDSGVSFSGFKTGVAKITLGAGATGTVSLWVGDNAIDVVDVSGDADTTVTGFALTGADKIRLQGGAGISFDNLIMGDTYQDVGAVPEPATMSLLALGGIAMLRRRKK